MTDPYFLIVFHPLAKVLSTMAADIAAREDEAPVSADAPTARPRRFDDFGLLDLALPGRAA